MSAGVSDQRMKGQGNQGYYGSTSGAQFQYPPFSVGDGTWSSTNDNLTILGGYATHDNYGGDGNGDYNTWGSQQVGVAGVVGAAGAGVQQKKGLPYDDYYREQSGVYQSHDGIKNVEHGIQRLNLDMGSSMQQKQNLSNITNNNSNNTLSSSKTQSSETSSTQKEVVPKKMTWASIASQPAKPQISTTVNTVKKKGPGMPPPPMVPGKHNLDIGTWDSPSKNGSMMVPQPLPIILTPPVVPIQILPPTSKSNSNSQQSQNMGGNQSSANGGQRPSWPTPGQAHNQQLQQQSQQHQPQQPQQQHHHQQQSSHNNQGGGGGPSSNNQSQQSAHQQQQQHRQQNLGYNGPSHHMMNHNQQHQGNYHHSSTHHQQQYQHHHNNQHHSHHQGPPHHQQQQQQPHHPHHQPNHHYNNQHSNHNNQRDRGEMSQQHREPIKHQTQQHQQQQQLQQPPPPLPQPPAQAQHTSANIVTTNSDQLPSREQQKVAAASPLSDSDNLRDLSLYNPAVFDMEKTNLARFFVIKSYSEDDIHRSIKYEIWCSTEHGNNRLDQAYREREKVGGVIYLFFSVNGSGHFCGIAQMITPVDYNANSSVWAQDKWKGQFKVKWIYVKDVPNAQLRHIRLENNEGKSVTNSRDAQEVPNAQGLLVLHIIHTFAHTTSIFDDFTHYEKRQEEEVTRKYEPPQQLTAGLSNSYDKNNQRPFDGPSNNNSNNNSSTRDHHHSGYNSDRDKSNYHGGYNNNNDNKGYSGGGYKGGYGFDKQQSSYNNRGGGSGYQYDRRSGDSDGDHNQYRNDGRSPKDYHDGNSGSYHPRGGGGFRNNNRGGPTGGGSYYHRDNDTRRDYRDGGGRPNYHNRGGGSNNDGSNQHHENSRGGYNSARAGSSDDGSGHRDNHRERSEHSGRGRGGVYRNQN